MSINLLFLVLFLTSYFSSTVVKSSAGGPGITNVYHIFPAIRRGFRPSRMTSNNLISPMKFCYNTNSTLPKQCQSSRSVLQDGSRTFGLFWKEKTPSYNRRNTLYCLMQNDTGRVVNFWWKLKIALTGVRSRVRESLAK